MQGVQKADGTQMAKAASDKCCEIKRAADARHRARQRERAAA